MHTAPDWPVRSTAFHGNLAVNGDDETTSVQRQWHGEHGQACQDQCDLDR
jgi:hypothetical protein